MTYDCSNCDWSSGDDSPGKTMPEYRVRDGVQRQFCPGCGSEVGEPRENNLGKTLGARF